MPFSAGEKLGPYEVLAAIGAGGMGEVYRARDPRLGRDVAVKVSAERFNDRFEREARAVAALNHPNICHLYDVGPNYLVMELIEGESPKGPLPLEEALRIARQIADALEAAHEKGIIHRDLKPANIKITSDGTVKVLDFGLAKTSRDSNGAIAENSPTFTMGATEAGVILGTAGYMSPEQARGKPVDKRADIWAFGVVLYEMLTGKRLFEGETVSDTLAAVLTREPDWTQVPEKARPLLQRCLEKDPKRRLRDIADMELLLDTAPAKVEKRRPWLAWGIAALLLVTLVPIVFVHFREQPPVAELMRFHIPPTVNLATAGTFALSPDGRHLAFPAAGSDGVTRLWVHALDSLEARPLPGTEGSGTPPFWSPDSRFIAFGTGGKLKKIDISGGPAQTLCDLAPIDIGGSWNRDGVIIFGSQPGPLMRVSAAGGIASPVTALDVSRRETLHIFPSFLPDGRHFVYERATRTPEGNGIYLGSLDSKPEEQSLKRLLTTAIGPVYVPSAGSLPGQLLFWRDGTLLAHALDERRLELAGDPVPVAEQVGSFIGFGFFSASTNGVLVYRTASQDFQLTWFDRQGKVLGSAGEPGRYTAVALSPDGTRAAVSRSDPQNTVRWDVWLVDLARSTSTRFTFGPARTNDPVWSHDGSRIIFVSERDSFNFYQKAASGSKDEELVLKSSENKIPTSWSRDGRFLLYTTAPNAKTKRDVWVLPLEGDHKPAPFLRTEFDEQQGQFSPDGSWVAYTSDESGGNEIYVRTFSPKPDAGGKWLVSRGGGTSPHWGSDGRELFYLGRDGSVMAVEVTARPAFQAGAPTPLFQPPRGNAAWDVTADGKRFLFAVPAAQSAAPPFTVVLNWQAVLKK